MNSGRHRVLMDAGSIVGKSYMIQQKVVEEIAEVREQDLEASDRTYESETSSGEEESAEPDEDLDKRLPPIAHLLEELSQEQYNRLKNILKKKHVHAFQKDKRDIGLTNLIEHEIQLLPGPQPYKETLRRLNPEKQRQAAEQVEDLINQGVVVPSKSPWAAGIVMANKKEPGTG